jgi:hypothetical protein
MATNIRIDLGGDKYLFFPSDNLFFVHKQTVREAAKRPTIHLGKQTQAVMYLPQKHAVAEQQARLAARREPICPRTPQDVNAAILWQEDYVAIRIAAEKSAGRLAEGRGHPGRPLRSLYTLHVVSNPALQTDAERDAAWKKVTQKIAQHVGTPVELTDMLGTQPNDNRYFVKAARNGRLVAMWTVVPVKHAAYQYRVELEQDTTRNGASMTTAIFTSTDAIVPCLDLSERLGAQAVRALAEGEARMRLD